MRYFLTVYYLIFFALALFYATRHILTQAQSKEPPRKIFSVIFFVLSSAVLAGHVYAASTAPFQLITGIDPFVISASSVLGYQLTVVGGFWFLCRHERREEITHQ